MHTLRHVLYWLIIFTLSANAQENFKNLEIRGEMTCISSNGVPGHQIGKFPNRANPNKFKKQKLTFCFPTIPRLTDNVTRGLMTVGAQFLAFQFAHTLQSILI